MVKRFDKHISYYLFKRFRLTIYLSHPNQFLIITFIIAIGLYFLISVKLQENKKSFSIDTKNLDNEEKVIIDKLKEKQGSMYQSDLIKETQYSKVKMTRILDKLESKGILEKKRRGMTNIVVLK